MNQSDFNNAFTELMIREFGPGTSPQHIAVEIFRRDQRVSRIYAVLSLFFWLVGTAGMMLLVIGLNRLVIMLRIAPILYERRNGPTSQPWTLHDAEITRWGTDFIHHIMPSVGG